jgi:predicted aspartyl protease/tetratricopeptide (TPR) repeat protein
LNARHLAPLLALILTGTAGTAFAADAAPKRCGIETMVIPVRLVESRPVATLKLNGVPVPLLVDSGAFYSFLSEASARQLELKLRPQTNLRVYGVTGQVQNLKVTTVKSVELEGAVLPNVEFLVGGNEINAGIMGVLGRNFLSLADTEYDLAHGEVRLVFPKGDCEKTVMAYWAGEAPVIEAPLISYAQNDRAVRVPVLVNGEKVTALMDTGAPTTSLTISAARKAGITESQMTLVGRTGGAGASFARRWTTTVERFEIGGEKVSNNRMDVTDTDGGDYGMLLGLDYFLSHRVYVSRLQGKVYATWNGGAVFAKGRQPAGGADPRYAAKPEEIAADDADGLARRGNAALVNGEPARALEDLDRAVQLKPTAANYEARSRVKLALKKPKEALADLDEALRLDPALSEARLRRVPLRMASGDRDGAGADLAELDATLPPGSNLRSQLGQLHARRNEGPQAIKQFDLWIQTHQRDARLGQVLGERCWLRARMNLEPAKAVDDCKDAVDEDGDDPTLRYFLGWARLRQGDASAARKAFDKSIELKPQLAWALYGRGLAQTKLGEAEKGRQDLEAARKLLPAIDEQVKRAGFAALVEGGAAAP